MNKTKGFGGHHSELIVARNNTKFSEISGATSIFDTITENHGNPISKVMNNQDAYMVSKKMVSQSCQSTQRILTERSRNAH
jgi:hypothetical protein